MTIFRTAIALVCCGAATAAFAQTPASEEGQPPSSAATGQAEAAAPSGPFVVSGTFHAGYRWTDTSGNPDKYREDLNLSDGPRLFDLDLTMRPAENPYFDLLTVTADHLGGDPFEAFGTSIQKFGRFRFQYRRNRSTYFYRDTMLPPERASVPLSSGGDFHTFDFERTNDSLDLDFTFTRQLRAFVKFNHQLRRGGSTTTFDIARDEFEFDRPLEQTKNDTTVGMTASFGRGSIYVDETYRQYDAGRGLTFLPGASPGENTTNVAELFFWEQRLPFAFTMPQTTIRATTRPTDRMTINGGFVYSSIDGSLDYTERTSGINFTGAPLEALDTGSGAIDRTTKLSSVDAAYTVNDKLDVIGAVRFHRFDQDGDLIVEDEPDHTAWNISTNVVQAGAQFYATSAATVTLGFRRARREVESLHGEGEGLEQHPSTTQTSLFVTGVIKPSAQLNVLGEYERGNYDNPFTLIAQTGLDRLKARVRYTPAGPLSFTGVLVVQRIDNSESAGTFDAASFTARVGYDAAPVSVWAAYSRQDVANDVTNIITAGSAAFPFASFYESNVDMGRGGVRYAFDPRLAVGAETLVYRNRGSFGLDWREYRLYAELASTQGHMLRLTYRHNTYDEQAFGFDDYRANLVEASVGYRF